MPPDRHHNVGGKTQLIMFYVERQQAPTVVASADTEVFGSWHCSYLELYFTSTNKYFLCIFLLCVPHCKHAEDQKQSRYIISDTYTG